MQAKIDIETGLQGLALICITATLLAVFEPVLRGVPVLSDEREELVRVTGFCVPSGPDETVLVYTDRGAFDLEAAGTSGNPRPDPWFYFRIGENYRVRVRGRECSTLLGGFRPQIIDAHRVSMATAQGSL